MRQSPGLLDYLLNHSALDEVLQETDYEGLTLVTTNPMIRRYAVAVLGPASE